MSGNLRKSGPLRRADLGTSTTRGFTESLTHFWKELIYEVVAPGTDHVSWLELFVAFDAHAEYPTPRERKVWSPLPAITSPPSTALLLRHFIDASRRLMACKVVDHDQRGKYREAKYEARRRLWRDAPDSFSVRAPSIRELAG